MAMVLYRRSVRGGRTNGIDKSCMDYLRCLCSFLLPYSVCCSELLIYSITGPCRFALQPHKTTTMLSVTRAALSSEATAACRRLGKPTTSVFKRQFNSASPGTPRHPSTQNTSSAYVEHSHHDLLNFSIENQASLRRSTQHSSISQLPPASTQQPTTAPALLALKHPLHVPFPLSFDAANLSQSDPNKLRATVRFQYFPECSRLVREQLGQATHAVPFDWCQTAVKPEWTTSPSSSWEPSQTRLLLRQALGEQDAVEWMSRRWVVLRVVRSLEAEEGQHEAEVMLEYDSSNVEGRRAESRGSHDAEAVGRGTSIDVRVLALLE